MILYKKIYYLITVFLVLTSLSCSTDNNDYNRYNIEGKWKLDGVYNYDLKSRLYESHFYDEVWNVKSDTIEATTFYHFNENFGTGVLKQKFNYVIFSDGTFIHHNTQTKIDKLTEDELIFSIKRSDHTTEFRYYSVK